MSNFRPDVISYLVLLAAYIIAIVGWWRMSRHNRRLERERRFEQGRKHSMCIAHVSHYVGDKYAAEVLHAAAEDWDSVQNVSTIERMGRERAHQSITEREERGSIVTQWLHSRAEAMDPGAVDPDGIEFHNYGEGKI